MACIVYDLHKASGGREGQAPTRFIKLKRTKRMLDGFKQITKQNPQTTILWFGNCEAVKTVRGGANRGTYAIFPILTTYAEWLDPIFALQLHAHISQMSSPATYGERYNHLLRQQTFVASNLSEAARYLCVMGKRVNPALIAEIEAIANQRQLNLPLGA